MPLNAKQRLFVAEYSKDHNATQAAIRAGYSPHTAVAQGSRLLTNAEVAKAVADADEKRLERLNITADDIAQRAWAIAQSGDNGPAVAALALLAKRHREFSEKAEVEHSGGVTLVRQTRKLGG